LVIIISIALSFSDAARLRRSPIEALCRMDLLPVVVKRVPLVFRGNLNSAAQSADDNAIDRSAVCAGAAVSDTLDFSSPVQSTRVNSA
jgi:hypothetical protein